MLHQPVVKDDIEEESFFGMSNKQLADYELLFPNKKHFPVLILSSVGPQHGRSLHVCLGEERLVIRQSKLYSFECQATAPLDLFARFLLSRPLDAGQTEQYERYAASAT